eukprot:1956443-Alexandrium_andersonii.AAC.1
MLTSRRRMTCLPVPGAASSMDVLMSGSMAGTRPYTALYGVLPFTEMSALPANTHSDKICSKGSTNPCLLYTSPSPRD